ncbi:MAG TPA: SusC/RagA family TonB-linked outer membrane protein [Gemmatimonadaceae bacterium]|nr:SusC/RagA family TonB-linked outer membrane protein [Gemmatimonadaceae bacterium]
MIKIVRRVSVCAGLVAASLAAAPPLLAQDAATVSGRVVNEGGTPLGDVSVYLEGMQIGTQTRGDGRYSFVVPGARARGQQATLTARVIGYRAVSAPVTLTSGGAITHDFTLASAPTVLSRVVITGEGTITTAEKLGNRIDAVDSSLIVRSNEMNVVQALSAKAPNVQIQSQSGDPGSSASIQIRGIKTLTGDAQPLFVVDGIPLDNSTINMGQQQFGYAGQDVVAPNRISDINPDDIESINILKGAAAAAIYGARAAQGVVLITTKSGKGGPTRYSLRSSASWDNVSQGYDLQRSYGQGNGGASGICPDVSDNLCSKGKYSWGPKLTQSDYTAALTTSSCDQACAAAKFNALFPTGIHTYDHWAELFQTGHVYDNTLSISGGDDRRTFFLSGARTNNDGFVIGPNNYYDRTTVRLKASQALTERLRLGGNVSYVDTRGSFIQRGNNVGGLMLGGLRTPPDFNNFPYLDPTTGLHRSYRLPHPSVTSLNSGRGYDNPLFIAYDQPATSNLGRVFGNIDVDYQPFSFLQLKYTGGADYYSDDRMEAFPKSSSNAPEGQLNRANFNNYVLDHNLLAILSHDFSQNYKTTLTLGQNLNSTDFRQVYVTGYTFVSPTPYKLSNTITYNPNDNETLIHRESYFGQLGLDMFDQLYLNAAVRNDGSSAFAQNNRRHTFPKASAAWTFSKITGDFGGKLDFGKIRYAYGVTGREPYAYSTLNKYTVGQFYEYGGVYFLKTLQQGQGGFISSDTLGNGALKPERTREFEGGLDVGFWHGFADASATLYRSRTEDVILPVAIAPSTGHSLKIDNAAAISNKGTEVTLNLHPLRGERTAWDLAFVYGRNRNNVDYVVGADEVPVGTNAIIATVAKPGNPVGSFEGFDFARCRYGEKSNVVNDIDINAACTAAKAPNGALYIDENGFPIIDATNRILGSAQPKWQGSFRTSLTVFKKITISGLVDVRKGSQAYDGTRGALYAFGTHKDTEIRGKSFVFGPAAGGVPGFGEKTVTGPGVGKPVVIDQDWFQGDGGTFGDNTAQFVEDAGFVKLREISVAYTLDQPFVRNSLGLGSIDLRLAGRNLHTWTKYRGIDPEMNLEGAGLVQGVDWFNNPQTRSVVLTVGLNR